VPAGLTSTGRRMMSWQRAHQAASMSSEGDRPAASSGPPSSLAALNTMSRSVMTDTAWGVCVGERMGGLRGGECVCDDESVARWS
jgi:hypothetical protein